MQEFDPELEPWIRRLKKGPRVRPEAVARARAEARRAATHDRPRFLLPAAAVAAPTTVAAALVWFLWLVPAPPATPVATGAPDAGDYTATMHFVLHEPDARQVTVVGDFNDWDPEATSLDRTADGLWSALVPLPPGSVRYSFLVDGTEWRSDPQGAPAGSDFGRPTSIAFIYRPDEDS